jgi:hypothetical protein
MSDHGRQVEHENSSTIENARVGYQVAVDLWTFQSGLNWGRFSAMLTANSIITAAIGLVLYSQPSVPLLKKGLPAVGICLCILWVVLMARGSRFHMYWKSQACKLEETYLSDALSTVSGAQSIRFGLLASPSQDCVIYGVIAVFAIVYAIALVVAYL